MPLTRTQLNNDLISVLTPIIDVPQHHQANGMILDYVDQQIGTVTGDTWTAVKNDYYTKPQVNTLVASSASTLSQYQVGVGDANNKLSGSTNLTWNGNNFVVGGEIVAQKGSIAGQESLLDLKLSDGTSIFKVRTVNAGSLAEPTAVLKGNIVIGHSWPNSYPSLSQGDYNTIWNETFQQGLKIFKYGNSEHLNISVSYPEAVIGYNHDGTSRNYGPGNDMLIRMNLSDGFKFQYNNTTRALLTTDGKLLLGTITDQGNYNLQVGGVSYFADRITVSNYLKFVGNVNNPSIASGTEGDITYNTADKKIKSFNSLTSNWDSQATEEWVHANLRVGKVIYVDKNNPYATDTRTGISQYSLTKPFSTINAAVNAAVTGDIVYVRPGTYYENVYLDTFTGAGRYYDNTIILDNCIVDGGASYAFWMNENFNVTIYMVNATIRNTGGAADRDSTSAIRFNAADFKLFGNSRATCVVSSVEGHAVYDASPANKVYNNVTLKSTNGWGFYTPYGNGRGNFTSVDAFSTNSGAIKDDFAVVDTCYIKGATYGLAYHNQGGHKVRNSYIEATSGNAVKATNGFSYQPKANYYNTEFVSNNHVFEINTHWDLGYKFVLDNCRMRVVSTGTTEMVRITPTNILHETNQYATKVESWFNVSNCIVNKTMFEANVRYNDSEYLNESNTQVGEDTVFFGLNVGFGIEDAQANLHVKGDAIFDVTGGTLNNADYLYAKDSTTGYVKLVSATGTTGGSVGSLQQVTDLGNTTSHDVEFTDAAKGIIMKSPDGSRWRVAISDAGTLTTIKLL